MVHSSHGHTLFCVCVSANSLVLLYHENIQQQQSGRKDLHSCLNPRGTCLSCRLKSKLSFSALARMSDCLVFPSRTPARKSTVGHILTLLQACKNVSKLSNSCLLMSVCGNNYFYCIDPAMEMSVSLSVQHFSPEEDVSIWWTAVKSGVQFNTDFHGPQAKTSNSFVDLQTFHLVLPTSQNFLSKKISQTGMGCSLVSTKFPSLCFHRLCIRTGVSNICQAKDPFSWRARQMEQGPTTTYTYIVKTELD